jgi:hypothetical protein
MRTDLPIQVMSHQGLSRGLKNAWPIINRPWITKISIHAGLQYVPWRLRAQTTPLWIIT